ncbi:hypothetical protein CTEN210_15863 [Chaetoceros tenuissimus]|uniref:Ion transport domain-containing protein n=1 Tax=Chaetoceros tenuissimus TaxID=426638 RepID=A0AAD3HD26_9STRA|nr:hypothetical protein CTEN210_15863 [Chaetoceros tenuissimus]
MFHISIQFLIILATVEAFTPSSRIYGQSVSSRYSLVRVQKPTLFSNSNIDQNEDIQVLLEEDDETCSIDNLDACFEDPDSIECSIENLDACTEVDETEGQAQSLRTFLAMPIIEVQLAFLVVLSSLFVGIGTLQSIPPVLADITKYGELSISAIFTLEYIARWKLNDFSLKYVVEPLAIIDLLAILPGIIKFAYIAGISVPSTLMGGALINLRLLRILRLQRVLVDYETFKKFELALGLPASDTRPYQLQLARVVISIFTLLSVTSGLIYSAEHNVNPDIPDYFTAVYFGIITLTTVGFGDIHPVTNIGRWIISGAIIVASGVIPAQAASLVEALLDRESEQNQGNTSSNNDASTTSIDATFDDRLSRIENKLEDTNARIDKLLQILESEKKI